MSIVFQIWADGEDTGETTPDITLEQFTALIFDKTDTGHGYNDMAYKAYLREHKMRELDDFEDLSTVSLVFTDWEGGPHWFNAVNAK